MKVLHMNYGVKNYMKVTLIIADIIAVIDATFSQLEIFQAFFS